MFLQDLFTDISLFTILLFLLFGIVAFPSFRIAKELIVRTKIAWPSFVEPGDPVFIPTDLEIKNLKINGTPMTHLKLENQSLWFGGLGLREEHNATISGSFSPSKSWVPFSFTSVRFFIESIPAIIPEPPKAVKLRIPKKTWDKMDEKYQTQKRKERALMREILSFRFDQFQTKCWKIPVNSITVSKFGAPRTLPNGLSYRHTGLDLRARTGTEIFSAGPGEVIFRDKMIVPGNLVVVHHGDGLYSRYLHLSDFGVALNESVEAGDLVGKAGATGRVEAAHLHWEVIWNGRTLSPQKFTEKWNQYCELFI